MPTEQFLISNGTPAQITEISCWVPGIKSLKQRVWATAILPGKITDTRKNRIAFLLNLKRQVIGMQEMHRFLNVVVQNPVLFNERNALAVCFQHRI